MKAEKNKFSMKSELWDNTNSGCIGLEAIEMASKIGKHQSVNIRSLHDKLDEISRQRNPRQFWDVKVIWPPIVNVNNWNEFFDEI